MYQLRILDHSKKTYNDLNKTAVTLFDANYLLAQAFMALWKKFPAENHERFDIVILYNGEYVENAPKDIICK